MSSPAGLSCVRCGRAVGVGKWWQKVPRAFQARPVGPWIGVGDRRRPAPEPVGVRGGGYGDLCDPCHENWLTDLEDWIDPPRPEPVRKICPNRGEDPATCQHVWEPHLWEKSREVCPYCWTFRDKP